MAVARAGNDLVLGHCSNTSPVWRPLQAGWSRNVVIARAPCCASEANCSTKAPWRVAALDSGAQRPISGRFVGGRTSGDDARGRGAAQRVLDAVDDELRESDRHNDMDEAERLQDLGGRREATTHGTPPAHRSVKELRVGIGTG